MARTSKQKSQNADVVLPSQASPQGAGLPDEEFRLFSSLDTTGSGLLPAKRLIDALETLGILVDDPRLDMSRLGIDNVRDVADLSISFEQFSSFVQNSKSTLIKDALQGSLVVPDFDAFRASLRDMFVATKKNTSGQVANYIPQLGRVSPENFAVSACTIDGQRTSFGNSTTPFCIQSVCKPINYCIALEQFGEETVHKHVGREPSGIGFNSLALNSVGLPHNPMINAGAIMMCSMIRPEEAMADRFDSVVDMWRRLGGGGHVGFNNAVYLSERQTADRNFALGYFMREKNAFPKGTNLIDTLEFYFQCCSIETTSDVMAIVAATLANGGICPLTGERILGSNTVKNCLSLMSSCGMYDFSGEFAFLVGLPAKSGVGGGLMVVVPNVLGLCIWSPALDNLGNSVRGVEFCKRLVETFNFHVFDSLASGTSNKVDPRQKRINSHAQAVTALCYAAATGDVREMRHLIARGIDLNMADYDGRTAMHLAASEGHAAIIDILIARGAYVNPRDRWGNTPLGDARSGLRADVITVLEANNAIV
ncbi:MAG: glutaminase A [Candidatus Kapabacteria bacterium]|jgi:glutaminase|nr:glutaminase A [Candidatus Kapabacteria bacterium]